MPKHFLYVMDPEAPAPAGDGDTESWFRYYKWNVEGEVFVPRKPPMPFFKDVSPGDFLWFAFAASGRPPKVFGRAQIVRTEDENRIQEVWYLGDSVTELETFVEVDRTYAQTGMVPTHEAEEWLTRTTRSSPRTS